MFIKSNSRFLKRVISSLLISSLLLLLGLKQAFAADMSINLFPQIGKPIYGVVEFGEFVGEPNNIQISSMADYEDQGFSKPAFLNEMTFKKLSTRKYLVTSERPVSDSNFVMLLDATFSDERKIYPIEISAGIGQGSVSLTDPITMKMASASMNPSNLVTSPAINSNTYAQPNVVERVVEVVRESSPIYPQQPMQPQILYSQLPMPSSGVGSEMPFYLGVIALTILLLVGMFIVIFALHRNDSPKSTHKKNDDSDNFASDMLKILMPSLVTNQQRIADNHSLLMGNHYPALPSGQGSGQSHNQWPQSSNFSTAPQSRSDIGANHWGKPDNESPSQFAERSSHQPRENVQPTDTAEHHQSHEQLSPKEQAEHNDHSGNSARSEKSVEPKETSTQQRQQADVQSKRPTQARSPEARPAAARSSQPLRPDYKQQGTVAGDGASPAPIARRNGAQQGSRNEQPVQPNANSAAPRQESPASRVTKGQAPAARRPAPTQESAPAAAAPQEPVGAQNKSEKLQLAIVYMNMGDEVMARMLLEEIGREGSDAEKNEAKTILAKMNNASDHSIIADKNDDVK